MSWDPYLDLRSGVLRNRLGITDAAELARAEAELTSYRLIELHARPLPGDYDLPHLQAFHRYIFGDVYDWAGELRTVTLGKGGALFCHPRDIVATADELFTRLARDNHLPIIVFSLDEPGGFRGILAGQGTYTTVAA